MDQPIWLMVAMLIGGLVASAARELIIEFLKQFVPQLDGAQKAEAIKSAKRVVRAAPCVFWGALLGAFIASAFFSEMVTRTIELTEGFLVEGAPAAPPQHAEVPTSERRFTALGLITIVVFGIGGGVIGYFKQLATEMKESEKPPLFPSTSG